ncbi:MAG: hypothetical protein M3273_06855 [Actinomycetota bacterium]|nr:hypothetical protein [Actinomycetota bacterium]
MKYLPVIAMLLALVAVMGGMGGRSARSTGSMLLVIGAMLLMALLFGLVVNRAL